MPQAPLGDGFNGSVCTSIDTGCYACPPGSQDGDGDGVRQDQDCDDFDPAVFPGATEQCDHVDSDCDGSLSDGFADLDLDGQPDCADEDADGDGYSVSDVSDCDDLDAAIHPGAQGDCDARDTDCDGESTDGYADLDGDGVPDCVDDDADGDGDPSTTDCDDLNAQRGPSAFDSCDAIDQDCDGDLVEGFGDQDGDGIPDCYVLDESAGCQWSGCGTSWSAGGSLAWALPFRGMLGARRRLHQARRPDP